MFASTLKCLALAAAIAATTTLAYADPVLRGDVTVTSELVTVGDLFAGAGLKAETAIFRAPAPGTTGTLGIDDVAAAVEGAGITEFDPAGLTSIKVTRAGVAVDLPLLSDLIAADLSSRGILSANMNMDIALDRPIPQIVAADTARPASLTMLRYMPGSSTFSARFNVSGLSEPLDIEGQIQLMIEAPHLRRSLPEGTILGADDVEWRMVPLAYAETTGLVSLNEIVGKQLQRQIRAGVVLRPNDISAPELIGRNQNVTVLYQEGALTLTTRGQALNSASLDEPVSVLNTMTNKVLQGTATANGMVLVTGGNPQIAGL
ncbi:flagellar basal body P-ring formation chaperone FlgA [Pelagibacterium xiamenense]|uniref:flagellar basal body P-ring formation chaperone FlgA n=1 Tax=Pelagibacterium xiamenense TaxID=2901140 RepID=UPI001E44D447|nr:flagellar basal body P-ring formation chaperone FlgA [Pelagibacterium xiamenense]MCD7060008.1 flagellar basal body P-ring formation chaperone FlgA [Pelagibacterium xiamenense]